MKIHWFFKVLLSLGSLFALWFIFYFGLPVVLPEQHLKDQEVYGIILSNQIWEGDIKITGDISSPTNSRITVLPGTNIKVATKDDKSNFDFNPWHLKSGVNTGEEARGIRTGEPFWDSGEKIQIDLNNLLIQGSFYKPVIFTSDSENPGPFDFNMIRIRKGAINQAVFSNYRRFEIGPDVFISDSIFRNSAECSLCIYYGKPKIISSIFENSLRQSIFIDRASPKISNNLFQNYIGEGIKLDARRLSTAMITNNNFEMGQTVIDITSGGQLGEILIARNIFGGSSKIQIACDTKVRIRDNIILGQVGFSNGCSGGFIFGPNYWSTTDIAAIMREKVVNKYNSYKIDVSNVLVMPPKEAGRK